MASITAVTASPTTVATGGGQVASVPIQVDGTTLTATIDLHENLRFSVDPADVGKRGCVVATVDQGGSLAVAPDGVSFVFTAS